MSKHHDLKCVEPFFTDVKNGWKPFEIRNNDRDFQKMDTFTLHKYDALTDQFTGDSVGPFTISYVTGYSQGPNQVVFSWIPKKLNDAPKEGELSAADEAYLDAMEYGAGYMRVDSDGTQTRLHPGTVMVDVRPGQSAEKLSGTQS